MVHVISKCFQPFDALYPLKGHTYLSNMQGKAGIKWLNVDNSVQQTSTLIWMGFVWFPFEVGEITHTCPLNQRFFDRNSTFT